MLHVSDLYEGNQPVNIGSPHKRPVTRKIFPFDDVIMKMRMAQCRPHIIMLSYRAERVFFYHFDCIHKRVYNGFLKRDIIFLNDH